MEPVLVKMEAFTMDGGDGVYDGACFYLMTWYSVFSKASGFYYTWLGLSLWQILSLSQCCGSLPLAKFQVSIINGSDIVCDGARFYLHDVVVCF